MSIGISFAYKVDFGQVIPPLSGEMGIGRGSQKFGGVAQR